MGTVQQADKHPPFCGGVIKGVIRMKEVLIAYIDKMTDNQLRYITMLIEKMFFGGMEA